ncbi:hypothetical protein R3P38DRAFT_2566074, partial [Favolaschia claudopus]
FFLEVTRNRTTPFWSHPSLQPLGLPPSPSTSPILAVPSSRRIAAGQDQPPADDEEDPDEELTELVRARATFDERLTETVAKLRDFCDGLEYQRQFHDSRMLDAVEREGNSFFRLIDQCLTRERRANSTRGAAPTTWDKSTSNAMFYRTRPTNADKDT